MQKDLKGGMKTKGVSSKKNLKPKALGPF